MLWDQPLPAPRAVVNLSGLSFVLSNKTSAIAFQVCLHHLKLYLVPDEVIKSLVVAVGCFHQDEKSYVLHSDHFK